MSSGPPFGGVARPATAEQTADAMIGVWIVAFPMLWRDDVIRALIARLEKELNGAG